MGFFAKKNNFFWCVCWSPSTKASEREKQKKRAEDLWLFAAASRKALCVLYLTQEQKREREEEMWREIVKARRIPLRASEQEREIFALADDEGNVRIFNLWS
jgi:hypothetical protein